jgi:hypothetical protein
MLEENASTFLFIFQISTAHSCPRHLAPTGMAAKTPLFN